MKILIFIIIIYVILEITKKKEKDIISIYFGVPGCGKTTIATKIARKELKKNRKVWSNVGITGANKLEPAEDIGKYMIEDGKIIIDEAGIEYNNRDYKKFSADSLYFYKYHRHYKTSIDFFSQGWDDCDKKIRTLAQRYYIVKPSLIPYFITRKTIRKKIDVSKETGDIIDRYYFIRLFGSKRYFAPTAWRYFNTLSRKELPSKQWEKW